MTLVVQSNFLLRGTVCEWHVPVGNVVEEVDLIFVEREGGSEGVNGGIAPPLVEESTVPIKLVEEVYVIRGPEPVKVADFEVGPLITESVSVLNKANASRLQVIGNLRNDSDCRSRRRLR